MSGYYKDCLIRDLKKQKEDHLKEYDNRHALAKEHTDEVIEFIDAIITMGEGLRNGK